MRGCWASASPCKAWSAGTAREERGKEQEGKSEDTGRRGREDEERRTERAERERRFQNNIHPSGAVGPHLQPVDPRYDLVNAAQTKKKTDTDERNTKVLTA